MYDLMENNKLTLAGRVLGPIEFYHEAYDEKFYTFHLETPRLSDTMDSVPVLVSEKILGDIKENDFVKLDGQLRTYNKYENQKRKLLLFAFARGIDMISEEEFKAIENPNELTIKGFVCRKPNYRKTPLQREICDLLIAVNRAYHKSDYIPSIAWGRNAKFAESLEVGACVKISGRIQSRQYTKKIDNVEQSFVAYELSISKINLSDKEEETAN